MKKWMKDIGMSVLHFAEEGGEEGGSAAATADPPNLGLDLKGVMSHKGEDGLNFFDDNHLDSLKVWGSDDPTKAKFRDADGKIHGPKLVKAYLDLQRQQGKLLKPLSDLQRQQGKLLKPLSDDATERERSDYRKTLAKMLNVPDTADAYEILHDKLPEGAKVDSDLENKLKLVSHKHNLAPEAVQAVFDLNTERITAEKAALIKNLTDQNTETETKLKADLGVEGYSESNSLIEQLAADFTADDKELTEFFTNFQNTTFVGGSKTKVILGKILADAARKIKGTSTMIPSDSQDKIDERTLAEREFPNSYKDM
jgi:hypothetical protein